MWGRFKKWLMAGTSLPVMAGDVAKPEPMKISDMALMEVSARRGEPLNPWDVKGPQMSPAPGVVPEQLTPAMTIAMDRAMDGLTSLYRWAGNTTFSEGLAFLGYPYLAELSQRPEYRRVSEIIAAEATRKWVDIKSGDEDRLALIIKALKRFDIQGRFRELAEQDGLFGRSQLFVDMGHALQHPELAKPMPIKPQKIGIGKVKNFKVVEPYWSYPGIYNSTNPLAADYYRPQFWYVMSAQVHADRLLTFVARDMPDILKPQYQFGGLSLSQMCKPYIDNWIRTRQSVSDLVHTFSTMVLATDMSAILSGGKSDGLLKRGKLFNQMRDNRGLMTIDKATEELTNVTTPLGGLDDLLSASQEQMSSVAGIPLVVLLGVTPAGLNASSDGEIRTFYASIKAYQERLFRAPLQTVLEIIQLDLDGTIDPDLTFEFVDLWEMSETDKATVQKTKADRDVAYITAGVVSNDEARDRLTGDDESDYYGSLKGKAPVIEDDEDDDDGKVAKDAAMAHAAGVLLVAPGNVGLFVRRSMDAPEPGTWAFPGGSIEAGELPYMTAARECMEEIGWSPTVDGDPIDVYDGFVTYRSDVPVSFTPELNDEHTAFMWAPLDAPPQPLHHGVAHTLGLTPP